MVRDLENLLSDAWQLRLNIQGEECLDVLNQIKARFKLFQNEINSELIDKAVQSADRVILIEIILLHISLMRLQMSAQKSRELLFHLEQTLETHSILKPFWFFFEKGMQVFRSGDNTNALELFSLASSTAKSPFQALTAKINLSCVLHNLGLPNEITKQETRKMLEEQKNNPYIENIRSQFEVICFYEKLHAGDFKAISEAKIDYAKGDQLSFLKILTLELPYHKYFSIDPERRVQFSLRALRRYQYAYRNRTLLGLLHPEDDRQFESTEWSDRLYLWVWRWLTQPERFKLEKVLKTLPPLQARSEFYKLNNEDRQIIRNSLLWLSLFDPSSRSQIKKLLSEISFFERDPLYEVEEIVIHYWTAVRDEDSASAKNHQDILENLPLYHSQHLYFKQLVETPELLIEKNLLGNLPVYLKNLIKVQTNGSLFIVDMDSFKITDNSKNSSSISEEMCRLMERLSLRADISFEELLACCFGIKQMDLSIHQPKVMNFIAKLKATFGSHYSFKTKHKKLYIEGNLKLIEIKNTKSPFGGLFCQPEWREIVYQPKSDAYFQGQDFRKKEVPIADIVSRTFIEKRFNKSRATTNRMISQWEEKGLITRIGKARATRYSLSKRLKAALQQGEMIL